MKSLLFLFYPTYLHIRSKICHFLPKIASVFAGIDSVAGAWHTLFDKSATPVVPE